MDNTLTDDFGGQVRPGMVDLLIRLQKQGHILKLWTNSRRFRAQDILASHQLKEYFIECLYREDYDPDNKGIPKDIRLVNGDFLVDDSKTLVAHVLSIGKDGFAIPPFRGRGDGNPKDLVELEKAIAKASKKWRLGAKLASFFKQA